MEEKTKATLDKQNGNNKDRISRILSESLIKATDTYQTPPQIIWLDNSTIATLGNFSASTGKAKAKKTFNVSALVAASLANGKVLNYRASLPEGKRKILYVDTEQSRYHCHNVLERILKLAGL
ncbi:mobilization protein, partial [Bacteroides cellulosilyticus]